MDYIKTFKQYGIALPEILLPKKGVDLKSWAVIACDQYTQNREYWKKVSAEAEGKPSTLHCILPEVYLEDGDRQERLLKIKNTMDEYISGDVFDKPLNGMIYLERKTEYGRIRKGLITAIDLEAYEWKPYSNALIRATEATIESRIPPRMEIRRGASLESPHIMLLVNDPEKLLVEGTGSKAKDLGADKAYDTELMMNAGHCTGWKIEGEKLLSYVAESLDKLSELNHDFMFAVGDGNHSLATAKAVWNEYKENNPGVTDSPLRYALVEIVNLYDDGLTFEPIHRVVFDSLPELLTRYIAAELSGTAYTLDSAEELTSEISSSQEAVGLIYKTQDGKQKYVMIDAICPDLMVSYFQPILDTFLTIFGESEIDFIHGKEELFRLGAEPNVISIMLPPISKDSFFATINSCGVLPRKSFSMGEASEKRFYMECRKLK